ncbi:nitrous oxide reductase family maturation protein NosD [Natronoglomus mannanivorans]|uniref:Nitrous oxide reductase family maturation protein NosD n=1 Tax=Natronoglomus mannanivorans TaxID=2979990 RepID=A0AAP3E138_9EURY|nr:nitrous oxide reductase family maturation protein NosD [Halobacteria archaeon AArc-xg1-1]
MREGWFAVAAVAVLVVSLAGVAVAMTEENDDEHWTPDVPDVDATEAPTEPGVATVDDREFDSVQHAIDAADPGDTVVLEGRFDERVVVDTPDVALVAAGPETALIDGGGEGTVLTLAAENVTVEDVWIRESGSDRGNEDAGVLVGGAGSTLSGLQLTDVTFGVWVDGVEDVTVEETTIAGREAVQTLAQRGNGIHLWEADGAVVRDNHITTARDGIYYSWSSNVVAENNTMWDLRYGVHYMYSNDNRLEGNVAFDNDVGFALMVSANLTIANNTAIGNDGTSGHGILVKDIDRSEVRDNTLVANGNGLYVYNAQDNRLADNLILENDVGIHITAGTQGETVVGNSFIENGQAALATTNAQVAWNDSERGNYWSDARTVDRDGDGTSEIRHQPAGSLEALIHAEPRAGVFAESPAFDTVRLAESSFPVVESPGAVDHRPLANPPHEDWRSYYENHDH